MGEDNGSGMSHLYRHTKEKHLLNLFCNIHSLYVLFEVLGFDRHCQCIHLIQSSFPLIQPSFVKLTQLAKFDKTSHTW